MNKILKQILLAAEAVAEQQTAARVPGAALLIQGIHKLVDKDTTNNLGALVDFEDGFVQALNGLKGEDVIDQVALNIGIGEAVAAFGHIKAALKH